MRQVGVIAAAARVALAGRGRLAEDHELARFLADGLSARFSGSVDPDAVETNILKVQVEAMGMGWDEIAQRLAASSILARPPLRGSWRLVTHRDVDHADATRLLDALS